MLSAMISPEVQTPVSFEPKPKFLFHSIVKPGDNLQLPDSRARVNFQDLGVFDSQIEVFKGPEFELLEKSLQKALFAKSFSIAPTSNRMAISFNERLPNTLKGIVTAPVIPGTVQLTPNGNLIALMRDCQVTGGYPRVLQLSEKGISALAQKRPGAEIGFESGGD